MPRLCLAIVAVLIVPFIVSTAQADPAGKTTLETAREFAESPDEVTAMVQGRPAAPLPGAAAAPAAQEGGAPGARRPNVLGMMGSLVGKK